MKTEQESMFPLFDVSVSPGIEAKPKLAPVPIASEALSEPSPKREPEQPPLFDKGEWWQEAWKGMPEFVQNDLEPFKTIYVHFETREDMKAFEELIGQQINLTTRSIWYPEAEIGRYAGKAYVDEIPSEQSDIEVLSEG